MINLEWFRTFCAIYECNNITEASKKLNMTQPGVSKHLAALESHIGKTLFERTTRRLAPTEYGSFLYAQINSPLQALEKVEYYSGKRAKKPRSAIRIGCTQDFFKTELVHKIYNFDMYIVTQFGNEKELIEALEMDKIQLLVGIKKHSIYDHQFSALTQDDLILICSKNIEIPENTTNNNTQRIKWLEKQIWFTPDNDLHDIKQIWSTHFNAIPKLTPRYILPSYIDTIKALQHSEGFSIIPKHLGKQALNDDLIKIPFPSLNPIQQERFYAYKLKNSNLRELTLFKEKMDLL